MKKILALTCMLVALGVLAGTTFLDWPANGTYRSGIGPAKVVGIDVTGAASNETVVVKRKLPDGETATIVSVTCSNAIEQITIAGSPWIFADDVLERTGTATNARVRLIVQD